METLYHVGSMFSLLVFTHFFIDWICQTHYEAMNKSHDRFIRTRHCVIYTLGFVWLVPLYSSAFELLVCVTILYWSHYFEDTYKPVVYWMTYVRRVPDLLYNRKDPLLFQAALSDFLKTPLGFTLLIAVDQIIHISFLLPIAYLVVT